MGTTESSESAASNWSWVVARPRFWKRRVFGTEGFSHGGLDVWPYLASLCCSLAFYSTFFASSLSLLLSRSGLGLPQPACQPASLPAQHPATEARHFVPGCSHLSRLNHSAVVCRPRLPGARRGHTTVARLSCSICHRRQYRQCCCCLLVRTRIVAVCWEGGKLLV